MDVSIDISELNALEADLSGAAKRLAEGVVATTRKAALNIKNELRDEAEGVAHAPALPSTITFDTRLLANGMEAQIGPVKGGAGSLALLYYGNSHTGSVLKDPRFALLRQAEQTTAKLTKIVERLA